METVLSVKDVVKHFGPVKAVDGVSFEVRRGSIVGLLGRNGAGKTTTIRMINSIFYPDRGSIERFGSNDSADRLRDRIGYLPEERGLYKQMKIMEHLLFLAEIKGKRGPDVKKRAARWLERLELAEKHDAKVEELSKGNQQKVQLAGTLLHEPDLVILDEPMSGLDPVNVVVVRRLLGELKNEGKTILLSTHMMGEAEKMADDIVLIHGGRVVLSGDLANIKSSNGKNAVHFEYDGDGAFLESLPGVEKGRIDTNTAELYVRAGVDPQTILLAAAEKLHLRRYEVASPSLEEIFIEKVGAETLAASDADMKKGAIA